MRYTKLLCATGTTLAVLLAVLAIGTPLAAEEHKSKHSHYKVIDVGTFGGPTSGYNFDSAIINGRGSVVGAADTPVFNETCGCFVAHAFRWENGVLTDLGALPGGSDSVAAAINSKGSIVGLSTNGIVDPLTGPQWDAVLWKRGQIIDLGNLGGAFAVAIGINDRGQIVGGGANTIADPFGALFLPAPTQSRALLWKDGTMQDLGTLGGNDAFAAFVNDRGQIAGNSLSDSVVNPTTQAPTMAPFFWENGRMLNIGTLGGVFGTVSALNSRGQVTGSSNLAGDQTQHAFLWERGSLRDLGTLGGTFSGGSWIDEAGGVVGAATTDSNELLRAFRWKNGHMTDLGSLRGDPCSVAFSGNSKGQVVGNSLSDCDHETHAFLWEKGGPMVDLNSFVPPGSGILLLEGVFIGESGEIAVSGRLANGDVHAFVLVPDDDSSESAADVAQASPEPDQPSPAASHAPVAPEKVAAFAARFTHRSRGFGAMPSKFSHASDSKVAATGPETGPVVTLNPPNLGFKCVQYQYLCSCNSPQIVTLTNVGGATLGIAGISADGGFGQTNTCRKKVRAGQSCTISVSFGGHGLGKSYGEIKVTDNAADSPQLVHLSGLNCKL